jgi:hypothetical protein
MANLTAMESFTSCGRLEPATAAEAAEAKRGFAEWTRGARNALQTLLEDNRNPIVN